MEWRGELIVGKEFERPVLPPPSLDDGPLYQHALLCQLGLPRKKVAGPLFERRSGAASLLIEGGPWHTGVDWQMQPIPYGVIPRLAFMYVCREAVRTRSALISIKPTARAFARELGLSEGGKAMERFRRQTIALWCCRMHLGFSIAGSQGQVKVEPFEAFRMKDADRRGLWPSEVEVNQNLLGSLLEYSVALEPAAVRALQSSALALDVYAWLAHRLCRVRERYGIEIGWQSLKDQFGQEYKTIKQFRYDFVAALSRVLVEYPEARVDVIRGGLRLLSSPSPARLSRVSVAALPNVTDAGAPDEPAVVSAAPPEAPETMPTGDDIPLRPETLSRLATLDPELDLPRLRANYAKLWNGKRLPDDIDERFVAYAKGFIGRRSDAATTFEMIAGQEAELPITAAAREEARARAPGWDISTLVREFSRWNRERGVVVKKADKAFLAWVTTYTKGRPPG